MDTDDGIVLVDTLYSKEAAKKTLDKIREISKIEYIIYTHGHLDHVIGCEVFMADQPQEVIASRYLPDRLDRYKMLAPYRRRITAQQFNLSETQIKAKSASENWVYPTKTFLIESETGEYHGESNQRAFEADDT